ncbi:MAG TPA: dienelactone hydrolase family protein [Puia sp.]|jgi:predicted peptidase|nr:dienelactone hydrolase family protein [Puia sp.]
MQKIVIAFVLLVSVMNAMAQGFPGFEKKEMISGGDTLRYRIQVPLGYDPAKKYPLILVLHGSGERGRDNEAQLKWGGDLFADSAKRAAFPAIVVFPQCPITDAWCRVTYNPQDSLRFHFLSDTVVSRPLGLVMQLLDTLVASGTINTHKIYVGGLSMGGMGTFEILWRKPHFFAAAFPICGAGDPAKVRVYARKFPIWVFHGGNDPVVPVGNSRLMVRELKAARARVTYNEYPGVQHDSWKNAFAEPGLLPWLFEQRK